MCNPRSAGLAEWRIARIERAVRPTDAQRPKLEELRTASANDGLVNRLLRPLRRATPKAPRHHSDQRRA
jgi:hypothetical protein